MENANGSSMLKMPNLTFKIANVHYLIYNGYIVIHVGMSVRKLDFFLVACIVRTSMQEKLAISIKCTNAYTP
jgi:hypothetical protein